MIKWKDVAHLYLGCECQTPEGVMQMKAVYTDSNPVFYDSVDDFSYDEIKPILRPLSDMTEEEILYVGMLWEKPFPYSELPNKIKCPYTLERAPSCIGSAEVTQYLLSRHFDLFGLIETNQAISKV